MRISNFPIVTGFVCVLAMTGQATSQQTQGAAARQIPLPVTDENIKVSLMLLRGAISALDQANATGDYSVFYAMTAPFLRERFNPADYAEYYAPMRRAKIGLGPALVSQARFSRAPYLNENGHLTLEGALDTAPAATKFRLVMAKAGDRWLLVSLDLNDYSALVAAAEAASPAPAAVKQPAAAPASPATATANAPKILLASPTVVAAMPANSPATPGDGGNGQRPAKPAGTGSKTAPAPSRPGSRTPGAWSATPSVE